MISIKSDEDVKLMREPCAIVRDTLLYLEEKLRAGMTTKQLDGLAFEYITSRGAKPSFLGYGGFPGSICVSIDSEVVHGIPGDRVIEEGEIVSVDVGAYKNGFHGDAARSFYLGETDEEKKKLVEVTRECFFKGIESVKAGIPLYDIGYAVQTYAEANGFSVVREMVGHGVGRQLHEDPTVPNYGRKGTGIRLKKGMTLAVEPMINAGRKEIGIMPNNWTIVTRDGRPSAHYENTVLVTEDGAEILTL